MSPVSKRRKYPNNNNQNKNKDGTECPTCEGLGEVDHADDLIIPDEPCWNPA